MLEGFVCDDARLQQQRLSFILDEIKTERRKNCYRRWKYK
jgi:hypothetical protein